jgi:hypothetical protein
MRVSKVAEYHQLKAPAECEPYIEYACVLAGAKTWMAEFAESPAGTGFREILSAVKDEVKVSGLAAPYADVPSYRAPTLVRKK